MTSIETPGPPETIGGEANGHAPPVASRTPRTVAILAVLVALTAAVTFLVVGGDGNGQAGAAPLDLSTVSDDVAGHYRYAQAHGDAFAKIPCWCGCQQFLGHHNLEDCFVRPDGRGYEAHAAGCGVCLGEAAMAEQMLADGKTAAQVAMAVNLEFGVTAITSPRS